MLKCILKVCITLLVVSDLAEQATVRIPPTRPTILNITEEGTTLNITWKEPMEWNGEKDLYNITIDLLQRKYFIQFRCHVTSVSFITLTDATETSLQTSDRLEYSSEYKISVSAKSSGGWSKPFQTNYTTVEGPPEQVEDLTCNLITNHDNNINDTIVTANWKSPCESNGQLMDFEIELCGRTGDDAPPPVVTCNVTHIIAENVTDYEWSNLVTKADDKYELKISARNKNHKSTVASCLVITPGGKPNFPSLDNIFVVDHTSTNIAEIKIYTNLFKSSETIKYYAVIVAQETCEEQSKKGVYDTNNWPVVSSNENCQDKTKAYQATPDFWNPFNSNKFEASFKLGTDPECNTTTCNRPLKPDTKYSIKIRGFTSYAYSDTDLVYFKTEASSGVDVGLIVGIILGILVVSIVAVVLMLYKKKRLIINRRSY